MILFLFSVLTMQKITVAFDWLRMCKVCYYLILLAKDAQK